MKVNQEISDVPEQTLIQRFNNKDLATYGAVYDMLFEPLCYFAMKLYGGTLDSARDVVHDVFISFWSSKNLHFENLLALKGYLYHSLKNSYINHTKRQNVDCKYRQQIETEGLLDANVIEVETISMVNMALSVLPEDCAKVFKLYIEGWEVKEIAEKLCRAERTVYGQKNRAVEIIKSKLTKEVQAGVLFLFF